MNWTADEKNAFVPLRNFGWGSTKTLVLPTSPSSAPPSFLNQPSGEEDLQRIPGAHLINEDNAYPAQNSTRYAIVRRSTRSNLFRIYFSQ
jgi:hypothetical protein